MLRVNLGPQNTAKCDRNRSSRRSSYMSIKWARRSTHEKEGWVETLK